MCMYKETATECQFRAPSATNSRQLLQLQTSNQSETKNVCSRNAEKLVNCLTDQIIIVRLEHSQLFCGIKNGLCKINKQLGLCMNLQIWGTVKSNGHNGIYLIDKNGVYTYGHGNGISVITRDEVERCHKAVDRQCQMALSTRSLHSPY